MNKKHVSIRLTPAIDDAVNRLVAIEQAQPQTGDLLNDAADATRSGVIRRALALGLSDLLAKANLPAVEPRKPQMRERKPRKRTKAKS